MARKVIGPTGSRRRRWLFLCTTMLAIAVAAVFIGGAQAWTQATGGVESTGFFELDGNTATTTTLGTLNAAVAVPTKQAPATSISVNETGTAPAVPFIIKVDSEIMNVTARTGSSNPRTYTVTRGYAGTTAAAHISGATVYVLSSNPPNKTCGPPDDWAALYNDLNTNSNNPPCSSSAFSFIADGVGATDHTYWSAGGSKDAYDPALGPWQWAPNDVSPDKNDIVNAFAAIYDVNDSNTNTNHKILFVGSDRYAVNGDAQMGYQFLQNATCLAGSFSGVNAGGTAACPGTTPTTSPATCDTNAGQSNVGWFVDPTTGCPAHHKDGDILLLVNFNNGGTLGLAGVFEWACNAGGCSTGGHFNQVLASGTSSSNPAADCATVGDPNRFCAIPNRAALPGEPIWPYTAKGVTGQASYATSAFVEGGVDLSQIPGAGTCFPNFFAETRSSSGPSTGLGLTAQLKDIAFGQFQLCGAKVTTTPADSSGTALTDTNSNDVPDVTIGTGSAGVDVTDNASMDVHGLDTWSGSVEFYICGPIDSGTCDSGGVDAGSANVDQSNTTATSPSVNLTSIGRYCWRGEFTPSSSSASDGLGTATDSSSGECFEVLPVTPDLSTNAWSSGDSSGSQQTDPVAFGDPLYDKASLSGTANEPGDNGGSDPGQSDNTYPTINATNGAAADGSISFTLLGPGDCSTVATGTGDNPETGVTVSGDGDYFSSGFTPDNNGDFHWAASYTGSTSGNTGSTDHNTDCLDANEDVTVQQIPTNINTQQSWYPNDTAQISASSGDLGDSGTVDFYLYSGTDCSGSVLYSEEVTLGTSLGTSTEVSTSNYANSTGVKPGGGTVDPFLATTAYADAADSTNPATTGEAYFWKVIYTPASGDNLHTGKQSDCTESHYYTYTNDNSGGTDLP